MIIDVQKGTTGSSSITPVYQTKADVLIETINQLIEKADPADIPVNYIKQQTENWLLNWATDNVMAKGYPGVEIDERVRIFHLL